MGWSCYCENSVALSSDAVYPTD